MKQQLILFKYLIVDFLEEQGFDKKEIDKLRKEKINYICGLAFQIQHQLKQKGIDIKANYDINELLAILDIDIMKKLLEVQSGIMAYGFYEQINMDKSYGLENVKTFMKSVISKDKIPDFSLFGLSNEQILEISRRFNTLYKLTKSNENHLK